MSERGYINRDLFVEVCRDLDKFLLLKNISRPDVLFMDGASPHISLSAAAFCKERVQPWLFKPNFTHLCQPLDLTFFLFLEEGIKKTGLDVAVFARKCRTDLEQVFHCGSSEASHRSLSTGSVEPGSSLGTGLPQIPQNCYQELCSSMTFRYWNLLQCQASLKRWRRR